jgi:hypothetical protein
MSMIYDKEGRQIMIYDFPTPESPMRTTWSIMRIFREVRWMLEGIP